MTELRGRRDRRPGTAGGRSIATHADDRGRHRAGNDGAPGGPGAPDALGGRRRGRGRRLLVGAAVALGLTGTVFAAPAIAEGVGAAEMSPAAQAAHEEPAVPGTPCSVSARACVDLETQQAWLIRDGRVVRGPMTIASGGEGEATPVGHSLRVYRQEADHESGESQAPDGSPAKMPYSTFFEDGGIAFHAGDPERSSAGCVRMEYDDAKATFEELEIGDKVQVVNGSEERAARGG